MCVHHIFLGCVAYTYIQYILYMCTIQGEVKVAMWAL
jgi:hypothetical protein